MQNRWSDKTTSNESLVALNRGYFSNDKNREDFAKINHIGCFIHSRNYYYRRRCVVSNKNNFILDIFVSELDFYFPDKEFTILLIYVQNKRTQMWTFRQTESFEAVNRV